MKYQVDGRECLVCDKTLVVKGNEVNDVHKGVRLQYDQNTEYEVRTIVVVKALSKEESEGRIV